MGRGSAQMKVVLFTAKNAKGAKGKEEENLSCLGLEIDGTRKCAGRIIHRRTTENTEKSW